MVEEGGALSCGVIRLWTFPEAPLGAGSPHHFRRSGRNLPKGLPSLWRHLSPRDVCGRHREPAVVPAGRVCGVFAMGSQVRSGSEGLPPLPTV